MTRSVLVLLLAGLGSASLDGQRPVRPARCPAPPAGADSTWKRHEVGGLQLALELPADLRLLPYQSLPREARRAREQSIPESTAPGLELSVAWKASPSPASLVERVLFYTVGTDQVPEGRPCSWPIAGEEGLVFRHSLSSKTPGDARYWTEAYWPGFVLAIEGRSFDTYEIAVRILRGISRLP